MKVMSASINTKIRFGLVIWMLICGVLIIVFPIRIYGNPTKELGDFLVENIGALGKEFRLPLFVVFMLDGDGRIVSVDHFSFLDSLSEKIPAEYLSDVSCRMKKESNIQLQILR